MSYQPAVNELRTLATGLCFANGLQLTTDEETLIVPETARYRVLWLDVKTGKIKHVRYLPGKK